jgi:hypothetical protein
MSKSINQGTLGALCGIAAATLLYVAVVAIARD